MYSFVKKSSEQNKKMTAKIVTQQKNMSLFLYNGVVTIQNETEITNFRNKPGVAEYT